MRTNSEEFIEKSISRNHTFRFSIEMRANLKQELPGNKDLNETDSASNFTKVNSCFTIVYN